MRQGVLSPVMGAGASARPVGGGHSHTPQGGDGLRGRERAESLPSAVSVV